LPPEGEAQYNLFLSRWIRRPKVNVVHGRFVPSAALQLPCDGALKQAVASGDTAAIIQCAVAMKPNFAKLFMKFGDYEGLGVES